jgi:hypothetical protein
MRIASFRKKCNRRISSAPATTTTRGDENDFGERQLSSRYMLLAFEKLPKLRHFEFSDYRALARNGEALHEPRSSCHTTSLVSLWISGVGTACLVVCEICSIYIPDWILSPLAEAISKPGVRFSSSPTQASNSVQSFSATTANGSNCLDQFKVFRCLWNLVS